MTMTLPDIAARSGLTEPAVHALHDALIRGRGAQAQFNHPDLGGMGQWMRGGMVMIGDMFNTALSAKVALACALLSDLPDVRSAVPKPNWWPLELGEPSQNASQDALDYAYFPNSGRLAIQRDGKVTVYDLSKVAFRGVGAQSGALVVHTATGPRPIEDFRPRGDGT